MNIRYFVRHFTRDVRVRFAPSPTGNLHLGGLRTALYNFLFARSQNGKFILRIEDTDRTRLVPKAMEQLESDLSWVGLTPDEGPSSGGPFGPYIQSERFEIYKEFAKRLLSLGAGYHCFCSEKRLELLRKDALRNRLVPKYDNHCRHLTDEQVKQKLGAGITSCIRFKLMPSEPFEDLVYGKIQHEVGDIEGDPVILKADDWPTYHLANVVDDYLMNISHVIRGVEWLLSTNKHIMIYRALGCEPPQFVHLPLLLNTDGTKLSKRQNDITVSSMRSNGILPRALLNYITQAGGGFPMKIGEKSVSINDLISTFDLKLICKNSGKLANERLAEFNRLELKRKINEEVELATLVQEVKSLVMDSFGYQYSEYEMDLSDEHIKTILFWSMQRISCLQDLMTKNMEFLWIVPSQEQLTRCDPDILEDLRDELVQVEFNREILTKTLRSFSKRKNISFKELMVVLRMSLSGLKEGPGVAEMLEILGKSTSLKRLERAKGKLLC